MGCRAKPQKLGNFREFFVLKVTLQSVRLLLTVSYRKNWGSRMYLLLPNNFVGELPCFPHPCMWSKPSFPSFVTCHRFLWLISFPLLYDNSHTWSQAVFYWRLEDVCIKTLFGKRKRIVYLYIFAFSGTASAPIAHICRCPWQQYWQCQYNQSVSMHQECNGACTTSKENNKIQRDNQHD